MADYYFPTVVQQTIPCADMTPLERLILTQMFDAETEGDRVSFFSEDGVREVIEVPAGQLREAFKHSAGTRSRLHDDIAEQTANKDPQDTFIELDLTDTSWAYYFQDIVRRSRTLPYLTVVTSYTCSKMRRDAFGGSALFIAADAIKHKSTDDVLEQFLLEFESRPGLNPERFQQHKFRSQ